MGFNNSYGHVLYALNKDIECANKDQEMDREARIAKKQARERETQRLASNAKNWRSESRKRGDVSSTTVKKTTNVAAGGGVGGGLASQI